MAGIDSQTEFNSILEEWSWIRSTSDTVAILNRLSVILEKETEEYYKMDPDPMDDRHPGRANPQCVLGQLMKTMFRNEEFMTKVVNEYLMNGRETDFSELHTAACRLLLDALPGLETSVVFQETDGLVSRLLNWAETANEPLCYYATGLLGGAMEIQDVAATFKDQNTHLVPIMLQRLHELRAKQEEEEKQKRPSHVENSVRHFAAVSKDKDSVQRTSSDDSRDVDATKTSEPPLLNGCEKNTAEMSDPEKSKNAESETTGKTSELDAAAENSEKTAEAVQCALHQFVSPGSRSPAVDMKSPAREDASYRATLKRALSPGFSGPSKRARTVNDSYGTAFDADFSNSSWAEIEPYVIGSYSLKPPLTTTMKERLILQYLTPMGDYQELLRTVFEHQAMDLVFFYINLKENSDVRLAFEALKYLATLLCHKKFAIEFLAREGVQRLLAVFRPSIAATGVALCLYYLSYFEDAMERVCLLPEHVLSDLVGYVLWLMECSHDSSRCHACMFFSQVFPFHVMLDLFDQRDGLRRLFNVMSTLEILNVEDSNNEHNLSEDVLFSMRQAARHVCGALKKYFDAQLVIKAEEVRRSHIRSDGSSPTQETPAYKPLKLTPPVIAENIELLMELLPVRSIWPPEATFHKLGGLHLLIQLVALAPSWSNYPGKPETIKSALDVVTVLTVTPKSQLALLGSIRLHDNHSTPALSVLTGLAEGEVLADAEVQKSALNVLINCVCGPFERLGGGVGRYMGTGTKKKVNTKVGEDVLSRMWNGVRTNNGIMVLMKLLTVKTPITEADSIRALACRALVGLCRSDTVKQIVSKLPMVNNGQLQSLMKEPVLQDKRQEHVKFCKYASQLLEKVSGNLPSTVADASLEDIRKADIVAQTKIMYREKELMQLIHDHLLSKGLSETAAVLRKEAGLPRCTTPPPPHPESPHIYSPAGPRITRQLSQPTPSHSVSTPIVPAVTGHHTTTTLTPVTPVAPSHDHLADTPVLPSPGPIRFTLHRPTVNGSPGQNKALASRSRFLREGGTGLHHRPPRTSRPGGGEYKASLDKIVTEYLRKQHALCRNPVATCPPMSLFDPHRCPEPLGRRSAPLSITPRLMDRSIYPPNGGMDGAKLNRRYIYNRFLPFQTFRDKDDDGFASCCFSADEKYLMLGTFSGDLKMISMATGEEAGSVSCHNSPIIHLEPSRDGKLLLTSSMGVTQESALWTIGTSLDAKFTFEDHLVEFSKISQDRVVGTKEETAHIYDTATGTLIMTLFDASKANNYRANMATFSPTDELVLNDGVLWDLRTCKPLHKFDKFNQYISGVFHPMGQEIIINSEVWDMRTFKLLYTVPALDQCQIKFNNSGDVIFATRVDDETDSMEEMKRTQFSSTLRTFDATDYSSIGTMDLKTRSIFDLCTDKFDFCLAVVEQISQFSETGSEESICRLYEIGKVRDEEDDVQEEEEETEAVDEEEEEDEDPSFLDFDASSQSEGNEEEQATDDDEEGDANAENMEVDEESAANDDDDGDNDNNDDDDEDGDDVVVEFSPGNSDDDDDAEDNDDNDDLDDDMLFALV